MVDSHLLFSNDTVIFCKDSHDEMDYVSWTLMWFEAISSLRINLEKSALLPVREAVDAEGYALESGCKVGTFPTSYLGLPLGASHKSVTVWDGVEERYCKVLWKRTYISHGGRLTLIRSTLFSMPVYFVSLFRMLSVMKQKLEIVQKRYLLGRALRGEDASCEVEDGLYG